MEEREDFYGGMFTARVRPVSMRAYFSFSIRWRTELSAEQFQQAITEFVRVADPTWTTGEETFEDLDLNLIRAFVDEWLARIPQVPPPLPVGSSGSELLPEPETATPANGSGRRPSSRRPKSSTRS